MARKPKTAPPVIVPAVSSLIELIEIHGGMDAVAHPDPVLVVHPPYVDLMLDNMGTAPGPPGLVMVVAAFVFQRDRKVIADPEVMFRVDPGEWRDPLAWSFAYLERPGDNVFLEAITEDEWGNTRNHSHAAESIQEFLTHWDRRIRESGYLDAYRAQREIPVRPVMTGADNPYGFKIFG